GGVCQPREKEIAAMHIVDHRIATAGRLMSVALAVLLMQTSYGQDQPASARAAASADFTGYWASVITQNWPLRMVTPAKGDYLAIPLTPAAKKIADSWDPARDEAAGNQCKGYGAALIMTQPERLHITWQDDNTLKMEIDAGTQTRQFHFGGWKPPAAKPS